MVLGENLLFFFFLGVSCFGDPPREITLLDLDGVLTFFGLLDLLGVDFLTEQEVLQPLQGDEARDEVANEVRQPSELVLYHPQQSHHHVGHTQVQLLPTPNVQTKHAHAQQLRVQVKVCDVVSPQHESLPLNLQFILSLLLDF